MTIIWVVSLIIVSNKNQPKIESKCIESELQNEAISSDLIPCLCEEFGGATVREVYTEDGIFVLACGLPLE